MFVIRKRLKLTQDAAIFLYINGKIPAQSVLLHDLYNDHGDEDGFLYITYGENNVFG